MFFPQSFRPSFCLFVRCCKSCTLAAVCGSVIHYSTIPWQGRLAFSLPLLVFLFCILYSITVWLPDSLFGPLPLVKVLLVWADSVRACTTVSGPPGPTPLRHRPATRIVEPRSENEHQCGFPKRSQYHRRAEGEEGLSMSCCPRLSGVLSCSLAVDAHEPLYCSPFSSLFATARRFCRLTAQLDATLCQENGMLWPNEVELQPPSIPTAATASPTTPLVSVATACTAGYTCADVISLDGRREVT